MNRFHRLHPPEDGVPPEQVRFTDVQVEPWPDRKRVKILMRITPFLRPPNLDMVITDEQGEEVARTSVIENIDFDLAFTLHLRTDDLDGEFVLKTSLSYEDLGVIHEQEVTFKTDAPRDASNQPE